MTSIAIEATRFSRDLTETAQASITPSSTPSPTATSTPFPPTDTPDRRNYTFDSLNLPPAVFSFTDPSGDTYFCTGGDPVTDPAVDILSVMVFDPQSLGSTLQGWLTRVELGAPAHVTFDVDWSGAVLGGFAPLGATEYSFTINEDHAGIAKTGVLSFDLQTVLPSTANNTFIDDQGNVWFLMPSDTTYVYISSFHLPTHDLPPDEKRCDIAPDAEAYALDLHDG